MKCRLTKCSRPLNKKVFSAIGFLSLLCIVFTLKPYVKPQGNRFSSTSLDVFQWHKESKQFCNGNYIGYAHRYFELKSTVYFPPEDVFSISCNTRLQFSDPKRYWFHTKIYAQAKYTNSLTFMTHSTPSYRMDKDDVVFIVNREYPHNFFHAMTQWYNLFILSKMYGMDMKNMTVLLLDRGPRVHLDAQWTLMFQRILKAGDLTRPIFIKNAIFNIAGHESPMYYFDLHKLPLVEEFSSYFLRNFNLKSKMAFDCKRLNITLVFRRDYYMHPGVSEGIRITERKFKNEDEIINTIKSEFKEHTLNILIAEDMSLPDQLKLTTNTDVLIAMHGCVLTQTLFLPKHAIVFEMYPNFWTVQRFFSSIARWRNIRHKIWQNVESENELANHYTYIPTDVINNFAQDIRDHFVCDTAK